MIDSLRNVAALAAFTWMLACSARSPLDQGASSGGSSPSTTSTSTGTSATGGAPLASCGFSERFGDGADQLVTSVAVDPSGATYLTGIFQGAMVVGTATLDSHLATGDAHFGGFLIKLAPSGEPLWSRAFDSTNAVRVTLDPSGRPIVVFTSSVPIDLGQGLLTPHGDDDAFVAALDADGHALWSRNLTSASPTVKTFAELSVAADGAGNTVVVGETVGDLPFTVLSEIDASGHDVWTHTFSTVGGYPVITGQQPIFGAKGDVTIALSLVRVFDSVSIDLGGESVVATAPSSVVLARFDSQGQLVFSRLLEPDDQLEHHIWSVLLANGSSDDFYVATTLWNPGDLGLGTLPASANGSVVIAHLDASGATLSNQIFGDGVSVGSMTIADNRLWLSGYVGGSVDFGGGALENDTPGPDAFVAVLDPMSFAHRSSHLYAADSDGVADAPTYLLATRSSGAPLLVGELEGAMTFCDQKLVSGGRADVFVAELPSDR